MSITFTDILAWLVLIYLASSPFLLALALCSLSKARREIVGLKSDVERIEADINALFWPEDPDGGEDNDVVEPSNVIAFGRKAS